MAANDLARQLAQQQESLAWYQARHHSPETRIWGLFLANLAEDWPSPADALPLTQRLACENALVDSCTLALATNAAYTRWCEAHGE